MEGAALGLLVLGVLLAEPVSRALARGALARPRPGRRPAGVAGRRARRRARPARLRDRLRPRAARARRSRRRCALPPAPLTEGELPDLGLTHVLALVAALVLALRLVGVLLAVTVRTLRARQRHRDLLDLLATPWPAVPRARVLDHPLPVAYCLPGLRSRLVVSAGVLDALDPPAVRAVLAHEQRPPAGTARPRGAPVRRLGSHCAVRARDGVRAGGGGRAGRDARRRRGLGSGHAETAHGRAAHRGRRRPGGCAQLVHRLPSTAGSLRITRPPAPLPAAVRVLVRLAAVGLLAVPTGLLLLS